MIPEHGLPGVPPQTKAKINNVGLLNALGKRGVEPPLVVFWACSWFWAQASVLAVWGGERGKGEKHGIDFPGT